jgi:hypothetical protein
MECTLFSFFLLFSWTFLPVCVVLIVKLLVSKGDRDAARVASLLGTISVMYTNHTPSRMGARFLMCSGLATDKTISQSVMYHNV